MSEAVSTAAPDASASQAPVTDAPETQSEASDIDALEAQLEEGSEKSEEGKKEEAKEQKNSKRKYSLKVNNKVKDLELDLSNDEEVQKYLQKALAADEKFQEASQIRKGFTELINAIKTNPLAVLAHPDIGVDIKKLAEDVLAQEIEDMKKSPEQKRIEELERALAEREAREKELEEARKQAEMAKLEEEVYQDIDNQITEALSESDLPKSPYFVKRIADTLLSAMQMGYKDVTVKQVIPFVEQQITQELNQLFETAPDQTMEKLLEKYVGKKNIDKYRKTKLSKAKIKAAPSSKDIKDTGVTSQNKVQQEPEVISVKKLLSF
jgi:hypothetical protein